MFGDPVLSAGLVTSALVTTVVMATLVIITAGYELFQAANNTAVMTNVRADQRGVTSGTRVPRPSRRGDAAAHLSYP